MLSRCGGQVRVGRAPFALDYGAVFMFAAAFGADPALIADVLADVEAAVIAGYMRELEA